jgi:hypothetical protein
VSGGIVVRSYQSSGTTEESIGTSGNDDTLGFSLFTGGSGETLVSDMLGRRQGFSSEGGLVNRNVNGIV